MWTICVQRVLVRAFRLGENAQKHVRGRQANNHDDDFAEFCELFSKFHTDRFLSNFVFWASVRFSRVVVYNGAGPPDCQ